MKKKTQIEIEKIARLAKLSLEKEELEALRGDLEKILDFAGSLSGESLEEGELLLESLPEMELREDQMGACLPRDEILAGAPESRDGFFYVPKTVKTEADV